VIIDAHVHLYPPEANADPMGWALARGEKHWATLCTRKRKDGTPVQGFASVDELLRDMDAAGVTRAVLLGWYWEKPATCTEHNRFLAQCVAAHPDRLSAFGTVHPAAGETALEDVRRARDHGFIGLGELSPHSQQVGLGDPIWRQLMTLAGQLKLPVNLHVTDPRSKPYPGRVETPLADFVGLAREFPMTKFILAHWGGGLAFDSENQVLKNVYYDTAASALLYGPEVWKQAAPGRVLFGSDYPLILYPKKRPLADFVGMIAEATEAGAAPAIFAETAATLLNLP